MADAKSRMGIIGTDNEQMRRMIDRSWSDRATAVTVLACTFYFGKGMGLRNPAKSRDNAQCLGLAFFFLSSIKSIYYMSSGPLQGRKSTEGTHWMGEKNKQSQEGRHWHAGFFFLGM